jgi:hypothetical protein
MDACYFVRTITTPGTQSLHTSGLLISISTEVTVLCDKILSAISSARDSDFNEYLLKIENNERPFKDEIFDLIDKYIDFALK